MKVNTLIAGLSLCLVALPAFGADGVGSIKELTGTATITQGGGAQAQAVQGASVFPQDVIATAPQSRVKIDFTDGTEIVLSGRGEFRIDDFVFDAADDTRNKARLGFKGGAFSYQSGKVAKKKDPAAKPDVEISVDYGSIGIRGTRVIGALKNRLNWLYVDKGEVEFKNPGGSAVMAQGNGTSIRSAADAPRPPYLWGEDEINWLQRAVDDPAAQDAPAMVARLEEQKQLQRQAPADEEVGGGAPASPAAASAPAQAAAEAGAAAAPAAISPDAKARVAADESKDMPARARAAEAVAPAMGRSITPPAMTKKVDDAGGILKLTSGKPATFLLGEADPAELLASDGTLEFSALLKAEELKGSVYLELRVHREGQDGPESYARNLDTQLVKVDTVWNNYQVQFRLEDGAKPDKITCSLVINGAGTILVKDLLLKALPK